MDLQKTSNPKIKKEKANLPKNQEQTNQSNCPHKWENGKSAIEYNDEVMGIDSMWDSHCLRCGKVWDWEP